ncbi:MAG: thioredoxin fold domain-containing protein, partial [Gammaproteobacteria bacterium]|nr:thioredoxin fold domain-containing protein [Gammaproteobacteria bacterium]
MKNTIMYRASVILILIAGLLSITAHAKEDAALDAAMVNPGYHEKPQWFKQSFLDIKEDIEEANANGKRLLLYFYQDGCPYCAKLLQDNFGQRKISKKAQNYFDVIAINMWGDREVTWIDGNLSTEKDISARMRVMFTPTMLFLDEKGGVALRVNGYYAPDKFEAALDFVGRRMERKMAFSDFYKKKPDGIASGKLHSQK